MFLLFPEWNGNVCRTAFGFAEVFAYTRTRADVLLREGVEFDTTPKDDVELPVSHTDLVVEMEPGEKSVSGFFMFQHLERDIKWKMSMIYQ